MDMVAGYLKKGVAIGESEWIKGVCAPEPMV